MFGKKLLHELVQYARRLWPYALAVVIMSIFARIVILFDNNPVEATGIVTFIGLTIMTALLFVVRSLAHTYTSFSKNLALETTNNTPNMKLFLRVQFVAFIIYIIFAVLLLIACISIIAWDYTGQVFSALDTDWYYCVEILIYIAIISATLFIIPIARIVASRFNKRKKLSLFAIIVTSMLGFVSIVLQGSMLDHSPSMDMPLVWAITLTLLAILVLIDAGMYMLTYRTLKSEFNKQNIEN